MPPEGREVEFSKFDTSRLWGHRLNCSNRAKTLHSLLNYQSLEENQRKEIIGDIVHFILRPILIIERSLPLQWTHLDVFL